MLFLLEIKVNMAVIRIMKCCEDLKSGLKENGYWRYVETNGIIGVALDNPKLSMKNYVDMI